MVETRLPLELSDERNLLSVPFASLRVVGGQWYIIPSSV